MELLDSSEAGLAYGAGILSGARVRLRPTTESDLPLLAEWWTHPDWAVLQQHTVRPRPREAVEAMFRGWSTNDDTGVGYSITTQDGELIGHATIYGATMPARIGTYAIIVGPDHTGRGYGTEATRVMLRYAFDEMGLNKVELQTWAFNTRAIRVYEKAGFVREGVCRARTFHNGQFHDEVLMGVLADEWQFDSSGLD